MKRAAAVIVALAAAVLAVVLATGGDSGQQAKPPATGRTPTATQPAVRPKKPRRGHANQPHRQAVRHGRIDEPAPGTGALLGIADQKPQTFSDQRFRTLGVTRSRLNTPWNSIFTEPARLAAWLDAARAAGIEPLVAFEHARGDACPAAPCLLPPVSAYERALRAFHARYPWVRLIQPWNEANSSTQPTGKHPAVAAAYYLAATRACPACVVTGADLLDTSHLQSWIAAFRRGLHGAKPRLWGLHNYSDVNRFRTSGTRRVLALVPGEVWMTEAGGIVSFRTADGRVALPYDENRAARATRFMFRLADRFPRIKRIYVYQWKIDFPGNRFDAGLIAPDGRPRPSFAVVARRADLVR